MKFVVASHNDDEFYEGPTLVEIEIGPSLYERILELQKLVKKAGSRAYYICEFNYTPDWYEGMGADVELSVADRQYEGMKWCNMDCVMLRVSDRYFWWAGYEKHINIKSYTEQMLIENLDERAIYWRGAA